MTRMCSRAADLVARSLRLARPALLVVITMVAVFAKSNGIALAEQTKAELDRSDPKTAEDVFDCRGRVVDPSNQPVVGAKVYLVYDSAYAAGVAKPQALTAADGSFRFTCSPSDFDRSVHSRPWTRCMLMAVAKGWGADFYPAYSFDVSGNIIRELNPQALSFPLANQWDRELKLVRDDIAIAGRLTDTDGNAVGGATIRVNSLWATKKEDLTAWQKVVERGDDYDLIRPPLDKTCSESHTLTGIMPTAKTDSDGRFQLSGGIGRERVVRLLIEGPTIASQLVFTRTRNGATFQVPHVHEVSDAGVYAFYGATFDHVVRKSIPVVGTVRDQDTGKPIAGVVVRRSQEGSERLGLSAQFDIEFPWKNARTETDAEGHFSLTGLPIVKKDSLELIAGKEPYLMSEKTFEFGSAATAVTVDASLKRGVKLHGRIVDAESGEPVDAFVTYYPLADNLQSHLVNAIPHHQLNQSPYRTDKNGNYSLPALPGPGILAVYVTDFYSQKYPRGGSSEKARQGKGSASEQFNTKPLPFFGMSCHYVAKLNPLDTAKELEIQVRLKPGQILKGRVLDPEGRPLAGASACGTRQFLLAFESPLNDATFAVQHYQPEDSRLLIFVHRERKLAGAQVLTGVVTEPLSIQLKPWGVVSGRIVDSTGKPKAKLLIEGWAGPRHPTPPEYGLPPERHYLTDEEGRFGIEGLAPGLKYNIFVRESGSTTGSIALDLTVAPGKMQDLGDVNIKPLRDR